MARVPRLSGPLATAVTAALALTVAACGDEDGDIAATGAASGDLAVFAAASLTDAFTVIGDDFTAANPDVEVTFNFGSSSDLVTQIDEGAPVDVYASADEANMSRLSDAGGAAGQPQSFATNTLEIIVEPGNPRDITTLADLGDDDLIVVTCDPEVPIGAYSQQVLAKAGVTVEPDSLEENVKAVANKVILGEADAGVVYATDVAAAGDGADGVEIPADVNVTATYPMVVTAGAPNPAAGAAFRDFVLGADGQRVLAAFGFSSP